MNKFYMIVGLRVTDPIPLTFGADCMPGYLCEATENHRKGFQLPGIDGWFAFGTNPFNAKKFVTEGQAEPYLQALCANDPGRWRPLILTPCYI